MIKFYQTAEGLHGLHDKATIKEDDDGDKNIILFQETVANGY